MNRVHPEPLSDPDNDDKVVVELPDEDEEGPVMPTPETDGEEGKMRFRTSFMHVQGRKSLMHRRQSSRRLHEHKERISEAMLKRGTLRRPRLPLHEAIQRGQVDVVRQIIKERREKRLSIDEIDGGPGWSPGWHETPLMVAVQAYHLPDDIQEELVHLLMEAGARLDTEDKQGRRPLTLAFLAAPGGGISGFFSRASQQSNVAAAVGYPRGTEVIVNAYGTWLPASILSHRELSLSEGSRMHHDVKLHSPPEGEPSVITNVPPSHIICDTVPDESNLSLGMKVLVSCSEEFTLERNWQVGTITAINPKGGFDVHMDRRDRRDLNSMLTAHPRRYLVPEKELTRADVRQGMTVLVADGGNYLFGTVLSDGAEGIEVRVEKKKNNEEVVKVPVHCLYEYREPTHAEMGPGLRILVATVNELGMSCWRPGVVLTVTPAGNANVQLDRDSTEAAKGWIGLRPKHLRPMPSESVSNLREATEGQLYPGAKVEVNLPRWLGFRSGMIQGRNTIQGGFNVLLRNRVNKATGALLGSEDVQHVQILANSAMRDVPYLSLLLQDQYEEDNESEGIQDRLLCGVHIDWIRLPKHDPQEKGRGARLTMMLCQERRIHTETGNYVTREQYVGVSEDKARKWDNKLMWDADAVEKNQIITVPAGPVDPASKTAGTQAIAIAAFTANLAVLEVLKEMKLLTNRNDLHDWYKGKSAVDLATDPRIVYLFITLGAEYNIARAAQLADGMRFGYEWQRVVMKLIETQKDRHNWAATSPGKGGLNALGWACRHGNLSILTALLSEPTFQTLAKLAYPMTMHPYFLVTKSKAMQGRKVEMIKMLHKYGSKIEGSGVVGAAAEEGLVEVLRLALSLGGDATERLYGELPCNLASTPEAVGVLAEVLDKTGSEPLSILPVLVVGRIVDDWLRDPSVMSYAREGWLQILDKRTDPSDWQAWNEDGDTALSLAICNNYYELVDLLLKKGCDPNARTARGEYPIGLACLYNPTEEIMELLLSHPETVVRGTLALPRACHSLHVPKIKALLAFAKREPSDINLEEKLDDVTSVEYLFLVARANPRDEELLKTVEELVMEFVKCGAKVQPALLAEFGWMEILREAYKNEAQPSIPDVMPGKVTALMHAVRRGNNEMIEFLLDHGSDLLQTDGEGQSPLVLAANVNFIGVPPEKQEDTRLDIMRTLVKAARRRVREGHPCVSDLLKGNGLLAAAAEMNSYKLVKFLCEQVDQWCEEDEMVIDAATRQRKSPILLARDQRIRRLLILKGFTPNIADLAREGQFRLILDTLENFKKKHELTQRPVAWRSMINQKSSCSVTHELREHHSSKAGRSALGWIYARKFQRLTPQSLDACMGKALHKVPYQYLIDWGLHLEGATASTSWVRGTVTVLPGETVLGDGFSGCLLWKPDGVSVPCELLVPIHELVLLTPDLPSLHTASKVLVNDLSTESGACLYTEGTIIDEPPDQKPGSWVVRRKVVKGNEKVSVLRNFTLISRTPEVLPERQLVPLIRTADIDNVEAGKELLDRLHRSLPAACDPVCLITSDEEGMNLLELAAHGGEPDLVRAVIEEVDPKLINPPRVDPLRREMLLEEQHPGAAAICRAAQTGSVEVVRMLLDTKVDGRPVAYSNDSCNGKSVAQWTSSRAVTRLLVSRWKEEKLVFTGYDLHKCARNGWLEEMRVLFNDFHADVNVTDEDDCTPLMAAAGGGHPELVSELLDRGAVVLTFDNQGQCVLSVIAMITNQSVALKMAEMLLTEERRCIFKRDWKTPRLMSGDDKKELVQRSRALSITVRQQSPCLKMINLLLSHGARVDENYHGKGPIRHLGSTESAPGDDSQEMAAMELLNALLQWKVKVIDRKHEREGQMGFVKKIDAPRNMVLVEFEDDSIVQEWFPWNDPTQPESLEEQQRGPGAAGQMLHMDFMHIIHTGLPTLVQKMVDYCVVDGYYRRALPLVCSDTLREALMHCMKLLRPEWEKLAEGEKLARTEMFVWTPNVTYSRNREDPVWLILRHLLHGLHHAHISAEVTGGPTLQQAVNELLGEEVSTLRLLPSELYRTAVHQEMETFFSDVFNQHQYELKKQLCIEHKCSLYNNDMDDWREQERLKILQLLVERAKEYDAGPTTLELVVEYGWEEAVRYLLDECDVGANHTNTANKPICTVSIEIDERCNEITGLILQSFFDKKKVISPASYVEFMRDRDVKGKKYTCSSLNDSVTDACHESKFMKALVSIAVLLLEHGANANPDDIERLSKVMRLNTKFNAYLPAFAPRATLLHVAAACNNANSVRWILDCVQYRDTLGSGIEEDGKGKTARHYTKSHECHRILVAREQLQQKLVGYMPPSDQIHLVLALRTTKELSFDMGTIVKDVIKSRKGKHKEIGQSMVLHALMDLDLGGFLVEIETESATTDKYVVVSGSETRELITTLRHPFLRSSDSRDLKSKEKHSITVNIVNSFSWPILDDEIHKSINHIEEAVRLGIPEKTPNRRLKEGRNMILDGTWWHYGHEVIYPKSLTVSSADIPSLNGELKLVPGSIRSKQRPEWAMSEDGMTYRLHSEKEHWVITNDIGKKILQSQTTHGGQPPDNNMAWEFDKGAISGGAPLWDVARQTRIVTRERGGEDERHWEVVDECGDVVYALLKDRAPGEGRPPGHMRYYLKELVSALPDGTPDVLVVTTPFPAINGEYTRDNSSMPGNNIWLHQSSKARVIQGDKENRWLIEHEAQQVGDRRIAIYSKPRTSPTDAPYFQNQDEMWRQHNKVIHGVSVVPKDDSDNPLEWILKGGRLDADKAKQMYTRKVNAIRALRQLLRAAGEEDLPFKRAIIPTVSPETFYPPNLETAGNLPPGQKWLDLLIQEDLIQQVFGVHVSSEANNVLALWQPVIQTSELADPILSKSTFFRPWLWEPFCNLRDFLKEGEQAEERRLDRYDERVKTYLEFIISTPREQHTQEKWDDSFKLFRVCRPLRICRSSDRQETHIMLSKGEEVPVVAIKKEGFDIYRRCRQWYLPLKNEENVSLLTEDPDRWDVKENCRINQAHPKYNEAMKIFHVEETMPYYSKPVEKESRQAEEIAFDDNLVEKGIELIMAGEVKGMENWVEVYHHDTHWWIPRTDQEGDISLKPVRLYLEQCCALEAYLGSKIAFYFAFISFYVSYLLLLIVTGLCFTLVQGAMGLYDSERVVMWNTLVVIVWGGVFLQRWQRKSSELAFMWKVRNVEQWEPPMAEFLKRNNTLKKRAHPITGLQEPNFTDMHRRPRYVVSTFITLIMIAAVVVVMYLNVLLRDTYAKNNTLLQLALGVENALTVSAMDGIFAAVAEQLNKFENHRTKSSLQNSAIIKSFIFRFINGFSGLMITVLLDPNSICDCPETCGKVCKVKVPVGASEADTFCDEHYIGSCTSVSRQSTLMVQLTTQLLIQSALSVMTEKIFPQIVLNKRQQLKMSKTSKKGMFPDALGPFAVAKTRDSFNKMLKIDIKTNTYWVNMRENLQCLSECSSQYGGYWVSEQGRLTVTIRQLPEELLIKATHILPSGVSDQNRVTLELRCEIPVPGGEMVLVKGSQSFLPESRIWKRIKAHAYSEFSIELGDGSQIDLRREYEIREGRTSPASPLTLSSEDRKAAKIPKEAESFVWAYPLDSSTLKLLINGEAEPALAHGSEQFTEERGLAEWQMIVFGAYIYLDKDRRVCSVSSISMGAEHLKFESHKKWDPQYTQCLWEKGRFMPITLEFLRNAGAEYYCWILPEEELESNVAGQPPWLATRAGAFVYLFRKIQKYASDGKLYLEEDFPPDEDWETAEEYIPPQNAKPSASPPEPCDMDRYFSIRERQTDSKEIILLETLRPSTSEEKEFNDYTMMMLQFSYVICFASVLPLAPLVALLTGAVELHTDLWKFLKLTQRAEATKASGIGAWLALLTCIVYISIPINMVIVMKGHGWREYTFNTSKDTIVIGFLAVVSAGTILITVIRLVINPTASWVVKAELKKDYESLQEDAKIIQGANPVPKQMDSKDAERERRRTTIKRRLSEAAE